MATRRWSGALAAGLTALMVTAGCSGGAAEDTADRTPAGWPQAADGKITEEMCGLLTSADWAAYGHHQVQDEKVPTVTEWNSVSCLFMLGDTFGVELQPSVASARAAYDTDLRAHTSRMEPASTPSDLVQDVVAGADASWFDAHTYLPDSFELVALRKGLLITLSMSARDEGEKPPQEILAGLARTMFDRVPGLGTNPAGPAHTLRLAVEAEGVPTADLSYYDPILGEPVEKKNEKLPFAVEYVVPARPNVLLQISANVIAGAGYDLTNARYSCTIGLDGEIIEEQVSKQFGARCTGAIDLPK